MAGQMPNKKQQYAGLMERYETWLCTQGKAESTARKYANVVRQVAATAAGGMDDLFSAAEEDVKKLVAICIRKNGGLSLWRPAMNHFFIFLVRERFRECTPLNPDVLKQLASDVEAARKKRIMDREQLSMDFGWLRDRIILMLITETALRPEELRVMVVGCYRWKLGHLNAGPRRRIYLTEDMKRALDEYLTCPRGSDFAPEPLTADSLLFTDETGIDMLPEDHFWSLIRQGLRRAESERETNGLTDPQQIEERSYNEVARKRADVAYAR
jgi:site-specific recombinase XerD